MENRPVGREKRVVSGGSGIKRTGSGIGSNSSARDVKKNGKASDAAKNAILKGIRKK